MKCCETPGQMTRHKSVSVLRLWASIGSCARRRRRWPPRLKYKAVTHACVAVYTATCNRKHIYMPNIAETNRNGKGRKVLLKFSNEIPIGTLVESLIYLIYLSVYFFLFAADRYVRFELMKICLLFADVAFVASSDARLTSPRALTSGCETRRCAAPRGHKQREHLVFMQYSLTNNDSAETLRWLCTTLNDVTQKSGSMTARRQLLDGF